MIGSYHWATNADQVVRALLEVGPVFVGTLWYAGMMKTRNGYIRPTGRKLGGHAYELNGVNTKLDYFRVKNSWGRDWGVKGRAKIKIDDFDKLLKDDGEACLAVELPN